MTNASTQTSELHLSELHLVEKPPREKIVKVSFAGCPVNDRKLFHLSKCIVPVCLGDTKEHNGAKFVGMMKKINSSFKSFSVLLVDSIYRYTLKINYPNETDTMLLQRSINEGKKWLALNKSAYESLDNFCRTIQWDEYLSHMEFNKHYKIVSKLYEKDALYKKALDETTAEYLTRHFQANPASRCLPYEDAFQCSINYLKEECACMCLLGLDSFEKYEFFIYPTKLTFALTTNYERLIKPVYPNLLRSVALRFHKK